MSFKSKKRKGVKLQPPENENEIVLKLTEIDPNKMFGKSISQKDGHILYCSELTGFKGFIKQSEQFNTLTSNQIKQHFKFLQIKSRAPNFVVKSNQIMDLICNSSPSHCASSIFEDRNTILRLQVNSWCYSVVV